MTPTQIAKPACKNLTLLGYLRFITSLILGICLLALTACNEQNKEIMNSRIEDLNKRIDQLEVSSEEILIRANSMSELELVVRKMEEHHISRLRDVTRREIVAKKRIDTLDSDLKSKQELVAAMEMIPNKYMEAKDRNAAIEQKISAVNQHIKELTKLIENRQKELSPNYRLRSSQ